MSENMTVALPNKPALSACDLARATGRDAKTFRRNAGKGFPAPSFKIGKRMFWYRAVALAALGLAPAVATGSAS